jgi:hypothetical protein
MDSDLARVLRQIEELLDDDIDGACSELKRVRFLLKLAGAHRPGGRSAARLISVASRRSR